MILLKLYFGEIILQGSPAFLHILSKGTDCLWSVLLFQGPLYRERPWETEISITEHISLSLGLSYNAYNPL